MLAMTLPTNIGGWGPREGAAAWLFALAGLGSAQGVSAATVYGVLVLAGTLPGAAVLVLAPVRLRRHRPVDAVAGPALRVRPARPVAAPAEGAVRG